MVEEEEVFEILKMITVSAGPLPRAQWLQNEMEKVKMLRENGLGLGLKYC